MLSATEQQEAMLHELQHIKHFFLSLFISSTGLVMSPTFLMQHLRVLAGGVVLTIVAKTLLVGPQLPHSFSPGLAPDLTWQPPCSPCCLLGISSCGLCIESTACRSLRCLQSLCPGCDHH